MAPQQRNESTFPRRGISRRSLFAGAAALGTVALTGCSRVDAGSNDLLDRLRAAGTVKVGVAGEIPFGYINDKGELTGQAPEIARVVFKRLGVDNVEPVPTEFGSLIPGLNAMQFDVVSAGMYINPDRCAQVIFSDPDYIMLDSFIVPAGNPKGLESYEDVIEAGATLASGTAYAEIDYAVAAGIPRDEILILPDQVAGLQAVVQGRADAFAGTALTVRDVTANNPRAEATEAFQPYVDGEPALGAGGFAFRPPETNLRDAFNEELQKLKDSGELLEIVEPFGFREDEMTDLTAEELCA